MQRATAGETISRRALNRATLERQLLLRRATLSVRATLDHLVGMQAQTPHTAYVGLWTRLEGFAGDDLSTLLTDRAVVRMALMRGTIYLVTARDAWGLRPLVQPVMDRVQKGQFGKRLAGVDLEKVVAMGRAFVDEQPRTFKALGDYLLTRWPDRDRLGLEQAVRTGVPLVQGAAARTVGPEWPDRPYLDRGLARWAASGSPQDRYGRRALRGGLRTGERDGRPGVVRPDQAWRGLRASAAGARHLP